MVMGAEAYGYNEYEGYPEGYFDEGNTQQWYGGGGFFSVGERGYVGYTDRYGYERVMRVPSIAHIGKNMPSHKQITRLRRNLKRHTADAKTILQITSPQSLKRGGRRMRGYRGYRRGKR